MFSFEDDALLVDDREDLIAVLLMRFGPVPSDLIEKIYKIADMNTLQRLILAAANAANWEVFIEEFGTGNQSFRLMGENFNPLRDLVKGREPLYGTEEK